MSCSSSFSGIPPTQSVSRAFIRPTSLMAGMNEGDLLRAMFNNHERSTNSYLLEPVELGHSPEGLQNPSESLSPKASQTLKRSHWKSIARADRCFDSSCKKKFTRLERKRNCCMCGEVYCRNCTRFRRRLSSDAQPDPSFGSLCHVCHTCYISCVQEVGQDADWTDVFTYHRTQQFYSEIREEKQNSAKPLPLLDTFGRTKKERILNEIERLLVGYETHSGWVRSIMPDLKVPVWHKSNHWVESSNAHQCQKCHTSFKRFANKINCRVCGQVYCKSCISEDLMLFITSDDPVAHWAINGKTGTPVKQPRSFTTLPLCKICSPLLEQILVEELEEPVEQLCDAQEDFMDSLVNLETILHRAKLRIENWLPQYQKMVDSMDVVDGSPKSIQSKSPINDLACAQSNLSDQFSQLAADSQKLRLLEPHTHTQIKLLKHVTMAIYQFYSENMFMFRVSRKRLADLMPIETIELIQQAINKMSIERVHIFMRQITFEAMNLEIGYKLVSTNITAPLVHCVGILEDELEEYLKTINENWQKHAQAVQQMVREDYEGSNPEGKKRRRLKIPERVPKTPFRNIIIQHKLLAQCSHCIHESLRELEAKTPDVFFHSTKVTIKQLGQDFDKQVAMLVTNHPQVFTHL